VVRETDVCAVAFNDSGLLFCQSMSCVWTIGWRRI